MMATTYTLTIDWWTVLKYALIVGGAFIAGAVFVIVVFARAMRGMFSNI